VSSIKDKELELKPGLTSDFSRRGFLRGAGIASGALGSAVLEQEAVAAPPAAVSGPGEVAVVLTVNGAPKRMNVEPRVTLLDALREKLEITGAKRVCDRGTCGACTVIMSGKVVYACSVLAVDAQGKAIQTIESLTVGKTHPIVPAFANNDALQCGYCTPGFVMASKGLLDRNPNPTYEQVKAGLGGNLCRCGTYVGIRKAVLEAAKELKGGRNA
jgi:xanthine dehydrogenase YagT iron-sulfur-binding subunit